MRNFLLTHLKGAVFAKAYVHYNFTQDVICTICLIAENLVKLPYKMAVAVA